MYAKVLSFEPAGLIIKEWPRSRFTVAFGEILTAERLTSERGLRLHTRTVDTVVLRSSRRKARELEARLRVAGVRIVDRHGAMIDESQFENERATIV
jgi:hypothetical protein